MSDKEPRDYWSECRQIFFHYGKGYGLTDHPRNICLGNEDDIRKFFETGKLNNEFNPIQRQVLSGILDYRKEQGIGQRTLEQQIWNEQSIMELLGINRKQLDHLRLEKGFPCVHLGQRVRVYLADEVLGFVKQVVARR
ncbi:helix-turn-helix transcriptional regulator [Chloroflexota bacterium]